MRMWIYILEVLDNIYFIITRKKRPKKVRRGVGSMDICNKIETSLRESANKNSG